MDNNVLWAPWRMGYILEPKPEGCFLCAAAASGDDRECWVVHRGAAVFVVLNIYPYNNGHLMVVPRRHERDLDALTPEESREMLDLVRTSVRVLREAVNPHGFNVGLNLGRCAGAGVDDHLHAHVVPRWEGDTNFMPVLAGAKVAPQSLIELHALLSAGFRRAACT